MPMTAAEKQDFQKFVLSHPPAPRAPDIFISFSVVQQFNCWQSEGYFTTGGRAESRESLAIAESWLHLAKAQKSENGASKDMRY